MDKFYSHDGEKPQLSFQTQKQYGCALTPASKEDFLALLPECANSDVMRELVEVLSTDNVYQVSEICASKGHSMPAATYTVISTYFHTFFIPQGGESKGRMEVSLGGKVVAEIIDGSSVKCF